MLKTMISFRILHPLASVTGSRNNLRKYISEEEEEQEEEKEEEEEEEEEEE